MALMLVAMPGIGAESYICAPLTAGPDALKQASATVALIEAFPATDHGEDVFITAADGSRVHQQIVSALPGEAVRVLVDTGAPKPYRMQIGGGGAVAAEWTPPAGLRCEVRSRSGDAPANRRAAERVWERGRPLGKTLVDQVFLGANPCGPDGDICVRFTGPFRIESAGEYQFATISVDASFVAVDGQPVVEWPGWHDVKGGVRAQHRSGVTLQPGVHQLDYLLIQHGERVLASLAWQPPDAAHPVIMPKDAFLPVTRWSAEPSTLPAISWRISGGAPIGEGVLVEVTFQARLADGAVARWRFDDGATATGNEVRHCFVRAGMRRIEISSANASSPLVIRSVAVHLPWLFTDSWSDEELTQRIDALTKRDLKAMPADDLVALATRATVLGERRLLDAVTRGAMAGDPVGLAPVLFDLGRRWQQPPFRDERRAEGLLRRTMEGATSGPWRSRAALHLSGLLIFQLDRAADATVLLEAIDPALLENDDPRLWRLYRGDAAAAAGDLATAQRHYREAGAVGSTADLRESVKRRARVAYARDQVALGRVADADEAERVLRDIEWAVPEERLGTETGLAWVDLHLVRQQPLAALSRCRMMLAASGPDARRATVLHALVRSAMAAGRRDEAEAAMKRLRSEFPYSEAAAKAQDLLTQHSKVND